MTSDNSTIVADSSEFKFKMEGHLYPATMVNLPCIIESHKSFDDMIYFKSGDIAQVGKFSKFLLLKPNTKIMVRC